VLARSAKIPHAAAGFVVSEERVVVVGAGLAGLAVATRLAGAGRPVLVLEASPRAGGQLHTWREPGLVVELGAEGFVARSRAVPALCSLVGLEAALVDQLTTATYALENGALVLLPPGEAARRLGFQVPEEELGRGIRSLQLGMGQLIDALVAKLGTQRIELGVSVTALRRGVKALVVERSDGKLEAATAVVVATPARLAAPLVAALGLPETAALATAPLMSNVSVNLLYRRAQFSSYPAGSGLIFPEVFAGLGLRALSLVEQKFAGRVPAGAALLRVFFRPQAEALTAWPDERYVAEAAAAIAQVLPVSGAPERSWVSRWADALPVFTPAHKAQVAAADAALQAHGVHVTGSAFHGAGIDAAAASAEIVAARLMA
jgi:oxygen-dependent protoporphyrinogen oxidase